MSKSLSAYPPVDGPGWEIGPGPLSPAWPRARAPEPPADAFAALAGELRALRGQCLVALVPPGEPFLLGLGERRKLGAVLSTLKTVNAGLPHHVRNFAATHWGEPVLPEAALFGARDLLPLLDAAISVAMVASERRVEVPA